MGAGRSGRPRLDVQQLRVFVALNDRGTVTAASKTLGLAQSTVSESLSALERALATPLILRRPASRRLILTEAGEALLPHARDVLAAIDAAHAAVSHATTSARAAVEIVANESISTYVLASVLEPVRARWPNTKFSISVAACEQVREGVQHGEFDLGLMLGHAGDDAPRRRQAGARKTVATKTVAGAPDGDRDVLAPRVPLIVFVSTMHPLAATKAPVAIRRGMLADYPLFLSDAAGDFHTLLRRFFDDENMPGPRLEAAGTVEGVKRAVFGNARALGVLPAYAIEAELRRGRFARVDLRPAPPMMRIEAWLSRSRARHPGTAMLLDAIRRHFHHR